MNFVTSQQSFDPYPGIGWVAAAVLMMGALIFGTDTLFTARGIDSLGRSVVEWSRRYPAWVAFFSFILGALLGHLFTKPPIWP